MTAKLKTESPLLIHRLELFFTYFGGKWRIARHYPSPTHKTLIEPFVGSAGYSLHYPHLNVRLYDADPTICGVWDYLIHASRNDILRLPSVVDDVRDLPVVCQEARWLIGFWLNKGAVAPRNVPAKWMRDGTRPNSFWGDAVKERIASQLDSIRHWKIKNASYSEIENQEASWFVDPPYRTSGVLYRFHEIDYDHLAEWCRKRRGQVTVCEQAGADWLPFTPFRTIKALEGRKGSKQSHEVVWCKGTTAVREPPVTPGLTTDLGNLSIQKRKIKMVTLFSGCGGADLGFIQAGGFEILNAYDNRPKTVETYVNGIGNATRMDLAKEIPVERDMDFLWGSPPCQEFSTLNQGKHKGSKNLRRKRMLSYRFVKLVAEMRPRVFIMENVKALQTRKKRCFNRILKKIEAAGYRVVWRVLNAKDFGVPQNRERLFVVGIRNDVNGEFVFPTPTSPTHLTLWDAIGHLPKVAKESPKGYPQHDLSNCKLYKKKKRKSKWRGDAKRIRADIPCKTITTDLRDHQLHPFADRRLSVREAALLQSFPANYVFHGGSITANFQQIADAVPPLLAKALAESVRDFFRRQTRKKAASV